MIEMSANDKQLWRLVLSQLEFDDLNNIAAVCKYFLFMLKEDQIFWHSFVVNNLRGFDIPENSPNWKLFYLASLFEWDKDKFDGRFKLDKSNRKQLRELSCDIGWKTALTSQMYENILYPFELSKQTNLAVGVALEKTNLKETFLFGVDKYRFGYYSHQSENNPKYCTNGSATDLKGKRHFKKNSTVYLLIHPGSYNDEESSQATISFFNKYHDEKSPQYQFSLHYKLEAGERFVGFVSYRECGDLITLGTPVAMADSSIIPEKLFFISKEKKDFVPIF